MQILSNTRVFMFYRKVRTAHNTRALTSFHALSHTMTAGDNVKKELAGYTNSGADEAGKFLKDVKAKVDKVRASIFQSVQTRVRRDAQHRDKTTFIPRVFAAHPRRRWCTLRTAPTFCSSCAR